MLLSTAYFPTISYIALCSISKQVFIESHEHYIKQSFRNRTHIASANGILDLIVPIEKPQGSKTLIKDVKVTYVESWQKQHKHAIISAYQSSPFFEFYADEFFPFLEKPFQFLWDFNTEFLLKMYSIIGISCEIQETNDFIPISPKQSEDYRYTLSPKNPITNKVFEPYSQVFDTKFDFVHNMSIIDAICNLGPDTNEYVKKVGEKLRIITSTKEL